MPDPVPSATWLIAAAHGDDPRAEYDDAEGQCRFCGAQAPGVASTSVISADYFNDDDLMAVPGSGHCCWACAYCLDGPNEIRRGQWLAHTDGFEQPSTGDLLDTLAAVREGEYDPPLALHVTDSPIRSSHAYLWTPVNYGTECPVIDVDRREARVDWDAFGHLLAAVEQLRAHGFRLDDIRSGAPRVADLQSIGRDRYRELDATVEQWRGTAGLELALICSRSKSDQPTATRGTTDHTTPIHHV